MMFINRKYNWIPDLPDHRDRLFSMRAAETLPKKADLRSQCSPVEDQGSIGSCTANALAGALEFLEKKQGSGGIDFSRLFIYYNERALHKNTDQDSGAMLRDGIKVLQKFGACSEKTWAYDTALLFEKPSAKAYKEALNHQILSYERLSSLDEIKACLASSNPVVFGFTVFSGFESQEVARTGTLNMPLSDESVMGGHAIMAVGYDDNAGRLIIRNSWGASWGQQGYFTMPYEYVTTPRMSADYWTISKVEI